jgi:nitroimidazol reductase NimA-like FMN-containing flavoprotein (pyridoxamine 5'-phosphate oxidase superfamily)
MVVHELSDADCREVVSSTETARLACAHGEQLHVVPISITYDGESHSLFTFSALGKKVQWMRAKWWLPSAAKVTGDEPDHVVFYRIRIDSITGRRAHESM